MSLAWKFGVASGVVMVMVMGLAVVGFWVTLRYRSARSAACCRSRGLHSITRHRAKPR